MNFISNNTTTELDWTENVAGTCELTHIDGTVIISYYVNGQFNSTGLIPEIVVEPIDQEVLVGETASFYVSANSGKS